jgi:hypothetical protein
MRKLTLLLSITVACVAATAAFGWVAIRRGFSARDNPSPIETFIATTARELAVPSQYRQLRNPLSSSSDLHAGMEHFADHCATCHANDGSGDTLFGKGFYRKPPDKRTKETQNKSDGELYYSPHPPPPATDRRHSKFRGVMIHPYADPSRVCAQVVDSVGDGPCPVPESQSRELVPSPAGPFGRNSWAPIL